MHSIARAFVAVTLALSAATGCGSDDDDEAATTKDAPSTTTARMVPRPARAMIRSVTESGNDDRVLHVVWSPFEDVAHVVSAKTIAAAEAADETPALVDFGDLRRQGDLDEIGERLGKFGEGTVDEYVTAIEQSADRSRGSGDLAERLASVADVPFGGVTEEEFVPENGRSLPADSTDFRSEWEIEEAPAEEYRGYQLIAQAMSRDIPSDVFEQFAESRHGNSPAFSGHIDDSVPADQLESLIAVLKARGYTVVRD
jgi:hypothetical protein